MIDNMFLFAVAALGWGLSLATYSLFARQNDWPMGALQLDWPAIPVLIGLCSMGVPLFFATMRGVEGGGWIIVIFGVLFSVFWTGFLRVGSQISLFLAPIAAFLLALGIAAVPGS